MIFDTDILIWTERRNQKAADLISNTPEKKISAYTYMELLQGERSKEQHRVIHAFLKDFCFEVLPITENISHRAMIYIEEYSSSDGLQAGDALIAATAIESDDILITSNHKHFKCIKELKLKVFKP